MKFISMKPIFVSLITEFVAFILTPASNLLVLLQIHTTKNQTMRHLLNVMLCLVVFSFDTIAQTNNYFAVQTKIQNEIKKRN